jgi:hypothetical protein
VGKSGGHVYVASYEFLNVKNGMNSTFQKESMVKKTININNIDNYQNFKIESV